MLQLFGIVMHITAICLPEPHGMMEYWNDGPPWCDAHTNCCCWCKIWEPFVKTNSSYNRSGPGNTGYWKRNILNFTAETQRTQRLLFFSFAFDPPKIRADRKEGKWKTISLRQYIKGQLINFKENMEPSNLKIRFAFCLQGLSLFICRPLSDK